MFFGEIVEPTTRALIDDELEDYPEYVKPEFNWEGNKKVPDNLDALIFIEGEKIIRVFNASVLNGQTLRCHLKTGEIKIYELPNNKYVICYSKKGEVTTGEIIEEIDDWLKKAKSMYAITCESISKYLNPTLVEKPETLIRQLSNSNLTFNIPRLEQPNLVSGLGADVLSYSLHTALQSTLFIVYMDASPLDSINTNPIIQLLNSLELPVQKNVANLNPTANNLYM